MLSLPPSVKIYLFGEVVDLRRGIDGLCGLVSNVLQQDPSTGHLFVFVGKSKDTVKVLFWDRCGYVLYHKRLEQGRFQLPVDDVSGQSKHVTMESTQLAMLLGGIDLNVRRLARWQAMSKKTVDGDRAI